MPWRYSPQQNDFLYSQHLTRKPVPTFRNCAGSVLLDPDDLRRARDHPIAAHCSKGLAHAIFGCRIGDENNGDGASFRPTAYAFLIVPLNDRFQRNLLFGKTRGDGRGGARLVTGQKPYVIAALMPLHRRLAHGRKSRSRPAERRGTNAARDVADVGKHRGGGGGAAGAWPDQR